MLTAAGRILLLRQRLQPSSAQKAAQRTQATAAAQQLVHTQLRQRAILNLRFLVDVVLRRQI